MSDSIENVLVELMRDNNAHIDKSNKSQLVTNDLVKSLVDKFGKLMVQNEELIGKVKSLESRVIDLSNDHNYLTGKIETMEKEHRHQLDIIIESAIDTENRVIDMHRVKKPKVAKPTNTESRVQCKCLTKKGDQCKKYCIPGHDTCKQHANMANVKSDTDDKKDSVTTNTSTEETPTKPVIIKKRKTSKKEKVKPPMHNHDPGEIPSEPCQLCITHGDTLDMNMPDYKYECLPVNGLSLEERLQIAIDKENKEMIDPGDSGDIVETQEPEITTGNENWADMVDE